MPSTTSKTQEKSLSKQADTEFVCKLCDMMQKYPHIINWDSKGQKMIVFSPKLMEQTVLPQYFRHGNFSSFIRQLNMYNYHKLQKNDQYDNEFIAFQHAIFKRGNERNFHFIQRKKRIKQQEQSSMLFQKKNQQLLDKIEKQDRLSTSTKQSISSLLEFKFIASESSKKIKMELENVHKELKDCRSRKISHALREIKDKISEELGEQLQMSKAVDKLLQRAFLLEKQNKAVYSNLIGSFYPSIHTDQTYPMLYDRSRVPSSKQGYLSMASQCGLFSQMSFSDGQVHHPIFYSNPQFFTEINYRYGEYQEKKEAVDSGSERQEEDDDSFSMNMVQDEELEELLKNGQKKEEDEEGQEEDEEKESENNQEGENKSDKKGSAQLVLTNGQIQIVYEQNPKGLKSQSKKKEKQDELKQEEIQE